MQYFVENLNDKTKFNLPPTSIAWSKQTTWHCCAVDKGITDVIDWCYITFGRSGISFDTLTIRWEPDRQRKLIMFSDKTDAVLCMLRWS